MGGTDEGEKYVSHVQNKHTSELYEAWVNSFFVTCFSPPHTVYRNLSFFFISRVFLLSLA